MASPVSSKNEVRRPYLVLRGSISRRDGPPRRRADDGTAEGQVASGKGTFIHYRPKSADFPDAKNQVDLTDTEARAFGAHKLKSLLRADVQTGEDPTPPEKTRRLTRRDLPLLDQLLIEGQNARQQQALGAWRRMLVESQVLDKPYGKKDELLLQLTKLRDELSQDATDSSHREPSKSDDATEA